MRVTLLQTDIVWENRQENLLLLRKKLETLRGETEIVVLPETFSTGFSMNSCQLAEPINGNTLTTLRQWATEFQFAIAGSYIACSEENDDHAAHIKPCYNRAFFSDSRGRRILLRQAPPLPHGERDGTLLRRRPTDNHFLSGMEHPSACLLRPAVPRLEPQCKQRI